MKKELERRVGRQGAHRFYLYFEVDRNTGRLSLETSWLPDLPEVRDALVPLGFCRRFDGSYSVQLADAEDQIGVLRRATKALAFLLEEATL